MQTARQDSFVEERQFGRTVGLILLAIGAWYIYRGRFPSVAPFLVAVGVVLVALGLAWPRALAQPYKAWMQLAEVLAFVSTRVILGTVFVLIVTPIGAIMRMSGWDPLHRRKKHQTTYWLPYPPRQHDPKHYEKMF